MDFKDLLHLVGHRWKSIVAMCVLAVGVAAVISFTTTPMYKSSARVFISNDTSSSTDAFYASAFTTARVQSYADLATSSELMNKVAPRCFVWVE